MAVRTVNASTANAADGSFIYELAGIVNDIVAAINVITAQLDADAGVTDTDYAANVGTLDTIATKELGTPS